MHRRFNLILLCLVLICGMTVNAEEFYGASSVGTSPRLGDGFHRSVDSDGELPRDLGQCQESCNPCVRCRPCCCQTDDYGWFRVDALMWWTRGMQTPPLVSASPPGTALIDAGVLGTPGATILFGGDDSLLNNMRGGVRFLGGQWIDCSKQIAVEGDYLFLPVISEFFRAESDGSDIISRPFFNGFENRPDAELVSYPDVLKGRVSVYASSQFQSVGARLRWNLGCEDLGCGDVLRWHLLTGYRYSRLVEQLVIREELESLDQNNPGTFDLHDRFQTSNDFNGGELGMVCQARVGRWDCELLARLGLGDVEQHVTISGDTLTDVGGVTNKLSGGLLAQRTNAGSYEQHRFAVIPEIGVTLGYRLGGGWSANLGYSLIVWNRVVRAGNQIDSVVDPRLIPPEIPLAPDATRPGFAFQESTFWAQGLNLGLSYRW